jgi:hypothetical protein
VTAHAAGFVLCIEGNAIQPQALLLCESIRRFAGAHSHAPILAIAPRPGLGPDVAARRRLDALDVEYVERSLNDVCPSYGSANRVVAAAWAESHLRTPWLIVLDSDTVFLDEPELPDDADVAVRPVDSKGSTTAGPGDPFEDYWARLAALQGVSLDSLPYVSTTDRTCRVRASYNGGLVVARRDLGLMATWAALFARSVRAGLRPWANDAPNVRASTGLVGAESSSYWGSNQAALALSIWSATTRVRHYPAHDNVPLHLLATRPDLVAGPWPVAPRHVHYHWMFDRADHDAALGILRATGVDAERLAWLRERLPLVPARP